MQTNAKRNNKAKKSNLVRIQKIIADAGITSRRKAEELILQGKVLVNGEKAGLGDKANPEKDSIIVNGKKINSVNTGKKYYIMLHKPRGFVTTMNDEMGRRCVAELIKDVPARVYPIGRLDKDSEGLLLLTNDGEFANMITHPHSHIGKRYRVTVKPRVDDEQLEKMRESAVIEGKKTIPAEVHVLQRLNDRVVLEFVLYDGKKRQIRSLCEQVGLEVARLKRMAIGDVKLGMLKQGTWRELTHEEISILKGLSKEQN